MIRWYWEKFMQFIGYRKVWYFPSRHMPMGDFWVWEYRPDMPKGEYTEDCVMRRSSRCEKGKDGYCARCHEAAYP